jgi:hypothetical protein
LPSASVVRHRKRWRVVWRDGGRDSPRHVSPSYALKSEAEAERSRIVNRLQAQRPLGTRTLVPLGEVLQRWLASRKSERHATSSYLAKSERCLSQLIEAKGWTTTASITRETVAGTKRGALRLLRAMLTHARTYDQAVDPHVWDLPMPPRPDRPAVDLLTDRQVQQMVAEATRWAPQNGVLAHLLATYGHRPESLAQVLVGDVDLAAGTIELPVKSIGSMRRIRHPLLPASVALLRPICRGRSPREPLLIDHRGRPWGTGQAMAQWWYDSVGQAVLGERSPACGIYQLKRYAISRMSAFGNDLATIGSFTGQTPETVMRYMRTNETRQQAGLASMRAAGVTPVTPQKQRKSKKRR